MSSNLLNSNSSGNAANPQSWKALWNRPGGTFAKITGVAAALGLGYGFFKALPMLIAGAANTLVFIGELVLIVAILSVLTSKNFYKWLSLLWLQLNRKILSIFVKMDPISILENGIDRLKEQLNLVDTNVTKLAGIVIQMKKDLSKYEEEFKDNVRRREATQKIINEGNLSPEKLLELRTNYIGINNDIARLEKIIKEQRKRIDTSEKYLQVMKKLKVVAKFKVKDTESQLRFKKIEFEQAKSQQTALKSIKNIFSGGLSHSLEEEMALDYIADTVNQSIAEMESFLDGSNDLLTNFDLDSATNIAKVDEIISKFEKGGFQSFNDENVVDISYTEADPNLLNGHDYNDDINLPINSPAVKSPQRRYF